MYIYILIIGYCHSCFDLYFTAILMILRLALSRTGQFCQLHRQEVAISRPPVDFGDGSWALKNRAQLMSR